MLGVNYADLETILQEVVPFLKLDSFSHQGVLTILFSEEMDPPRDLSIIDSSVIEFEIDTPDPDYINYRAYKWYLSAYNPLNCTFQFGFEYPPWISSGSDRDKIVLKFVNPAAFINTERR